MRKNLVKLVFSILGIMIFSLILFSFADGGKGKPWDIPAKYKKMKNPTTANAENLKIGKQLYDKHCASCHGKKGLGDGVKGKKLDTEMPDITTKTYKSQADGVKYYQSFIGRDDMPNFEKKIPDEEDRWFIINYMDKF
ncbi:MAG: cytochrome c [Saprospiraceae bacterium]|nr:cytochrome c [Saprospiraceae bacterium]